MRRSTTVAVAAAAFLTLVGVGAASADTHTGYQITITCESGTTYVVSPTGPAAASQDVSSTQTVIFAYGAAYAPDHFPAGKVEYCDLSNQTTGNSYSGLPFLVRGAP